MHDPHQIGAMHGVVTGHSLVVCSAEPAGGTPTGCHATPCWCMKQPRKWEGTALYYCTINSCLSELAHIIGSIDLTVFDCLPRQNLCPRQTRPCLTECMHYAKMQFCHRGEDVRGSVLVSTKLWLAAMPWQIWPTTAAQLAQNPKTLGPLNLDNMTNDVTRVGETIKQMRVCSL